MSNATGRAVLGQHNVDKRRSVIEAARQPASNDGTIIFESDPLQK
jgi:hypothetical protein